MSTSLVCNDGRRAGSYLQQDHKRNHVCLESMRRRQPTSCWCLMISFPHPGLTTIPHTPPSSRQCRQPRVKARPWAGSPHLGKLESSSPAISIKHRVNTLLYWATLTSTTVLFAAALICPSHLAADNMSTPCMDIGLLGPGLQCLALFYAKNEN